MKRPFKLVAEIQDKDAEIDAMAKLAVLLKADIAEKDAEIERLKETTTLLQRECAKRGQRVADLERLVIRAADALERVDKNWPNEDYGADAKLIAELRKAAE